MLRKISQFVDIVPGECVVIDKIIPKELTLRPFREASSDMLRSTMFDPRLEHMPGIVPVPKGTRLYIKSRITAAGVRVWGNETTQELIAKIKKEELNIDDLMPQAKAHQGIRVPIGSNRAFELETGLAVVDDLQRAYDIFVSALSGMRQGSPWGANRVQAGWERIITEISRKLFYKRGLIDNLVGCRMPFSSRAVIVGDPKMRLTQVGVPEAVIRNWLRKPEFQAAFNATESKDMKNKWCMVGRQPTHDWTNILSFQITPVKGSALHVNPCVVHQFDGDFDGDTAWISMFILPESQAELPKFSATADHVMAQFKFRKELKDFAPEDIPTREHELDGCIRTVLNKSTTGRSINWHDMIGDDDGTGYLDNKINVDELRTYANGMSATDFVGKSIHGQTFADAVINYRTIKSGTAKMGGLSNSLKQLATAHTWGNTNVETLRSFGTVKHGLCQGQLAAKHGALHTGEEVCNILQKMFYRPQASPVKGFDNYVGFFTDLGLPETDVRRVMELYFSVRPEENINTVLDELNPTFMLTRSRAGIHLLDNLVGRKPQSFHDTFFAGRPDLI